MTNESDSNSEKSSPCLIGIKKLRKFYAGKYRGTNLHHPIPVSRVAGHSLSPEVSQNRLIVFPYNVVAHDAYHILMWNLRIDQVWADLKPIYRSIFETREDHISRWWFRGADLESGDYIERSSFGNRKKWRIKDRIETKHLINLWSRTFGSEDLSTAENLLKMMMLFMVFGQEMTDQEKLFNNSNISKFVESNNKLNNYQFWASQTLFGEGGSVPGIKSTIAGILNKNKFYSVK